VYLGVGVDIFKILEKISYREITVFGSFDCTPTLRQQVHQLLRIRLVYKIFNFLTVKIRHYSLYTNLHQPNKYISNR
jgi:hypothetical protein